MSAELFIDDKVQVIETGLVGVVVGVHGEFSYAVRFYEDDECEFFERSQLRHISYACWNTGTKAQTLVFLKEIGRDDVATVINDLAAIEQEDNVDDWDTAIMDCGICGHRQTTVFPHNADADSFECHSCRNMAARPVIIDEDERNLDAQPPLPKIVEVSEYAMKDGFRIKYLDGDGEEQFVDVDTFHMHVLPRNAEDWQEYLPRILREKGLL